MRQSPLVNLVHQAYCCLSLQSSGISEAIVVDRISSLSNAWRQVMLSVALVFAPISTLQACCCVIKNAATGANQTKSCCAPKGTAVRSCCQNRTRTSSDCDQAAKKCECRCSEAPPFRPVAVRATSEKSDTIRVTWLSEVHCPIEVYEHQELPAAGRDPDDHHAVPQNRAQALLCVWRN